MSGAAPAAAHCLYLDGYLDARDDPLAVREARGRYRLLAEGPVFVGPGETIVGALYRSTAAEPLVNRTSAHYVQASVLEAIGAADGPAARGAVEQKIERLSDTVVDCAFPARYTEEERLATESGTALCCHFNGHMALDYARLLGLGVSGLKEEVRRARGRRQAADDLSGEQRAFYRAMEITLDGMEAFVRRHGEEAGRRLREPRAGDSPEILTRVRDCCLRIAADPPSSLHDALQLLWFGMMLGDYDSFGRFDQYLLAFYQASIAAGTPEGEILDLLAALWRKIEEQGAIMNMTIGGMRPDGSDGANPLTFLALRTTRSLGMRSPNLCLRIGPDSRSDLWEEVHRCLATGQSLPALYNDDLVIPMLERAGIARQDARDYCLAGCSQVVIPGRSSFGCDMGAYNALKCLELALHDGRDPRTGAQAGPRTGAARDFGSLADLRAAWSSQVRHAVRVGVSICNKDSRFREDFCSCVRSLLTADCLDRGASIFRGGARYYAIQSEIIGLTNTANAMAAIDEVVFRNRALGLEELVAVLDADFAGREEVRQRLARAPKFGNDIAEVDRLRASISAEFYDELAAHRAEPGGRHWPGEVIFSYHVDLAKYVGASADGRRAWTALADSAGAAQGTDTGGPTALLASMLAVPQDRCTTCCSLTLAFTPRLWAGAREEIVHLLRAYFRGGGFQVQVNVLDGRALRDARLHPEEHRSLVVRVGGFSAYFTQLSPALQEEIIQRTQHGAL